MNIRELKVENDERSIREKRIRIEMASARIDENDTFSVHGEVSIESAYSNPDDYKYEVCIRIENRKGNLIYSMADPCLINLKVNSFETFSMYRFHASRYFAAEEAERVVLYVRYA